MSTYKNSYNHEYNSKLINTFLIQTCVESLSFKLEIFYHPYVSAGFTTRLKEIKIYVIYNFLANFLDFNHICSVEHNGFYSFHFFGEAFLVFCIFIIGTFIILLFLCNHLFVLFILIQICHHFRKKNAQLKIEIRIFQNARDDFFKIIK